MGAAAAAGCIEGCRDMLERLAIVVVADSSALSLCSAETGQVERAVLRSNAREDEGALVKRNIQRVREVDVDGYSAHGSSIKSVCWSIATFRPCGRMLAISSSRSYGVSAATARARCSARQAGAAGACLRAVGRKHLQREREEVRTGLRDTRAIDAVVHAHAQLAQW